LSAPGACGDLANIDNADWYESKIFFCQQGFFAGKPPAGREGTDVPHTLKIFPKGAGISAG
jgi:hypothetical protein